MNRRRFCTSYHSTPIGVLEQYFFWPSPYEDSKDKDADFATYEEVMKHDKNLDINIIEEFKKYKVDNSWFILSYKPGDNINDYTVELPCSSLDVSYLIHEEINGVSVFYNIAPKNNNTSPFSIGDTEINFSGRFYYLLVYNSNKLLIVDIIVKNNKFFDNIKNKYLELTRGSISSSESPEYLICNNVFISNLAESLNSDDYIIKEKFLPFSDKSRALSTKYNSKNYNLWIVQVTAPVIQQKEIGVLLNCYDSIKIPYVENTIIELTLNKFYAEVNNVKYYKRLFLYLAGGYFTFKKNSKKRYIIANSSYYKLGINKYKFGYCLYIPYENNFGFTSTTSIKYYIANKNLLGGEFYDNLGFTDTLSIPEMYTLSYFPFGNMNFKKIIINKGVKAGSNISLPKTLKLIVLRTKEDTHISSLLYYMNKNISSIILQGDALLSYHFDKTGKFLYYNNILYWLDPSFAPEILNIGEDCLVIPELCFDRRDNISQYTFPKALKRIEFAALANNNLSGDIILYDNIEFLGRYSFSGSFRKKTSNLVISQNKNNKDIIIEYRAFSSNFFNKITLCKNLSPDVDILTDTLFNLININGNYFFHINSVNSSLSGRALINISPEATFYQEDISTHIIYYNNTSKDIHSAFCLKSTNIPKNITFSNNVNYIEGGLFYKTIIEKVKLPNNINTIYEYTFGFSNLKSLYIPDGIITIYRCIYGCLNLKYLRIPKSATSLDIMIGDNYTNLNTLVLNWDTPESIVLKNKIQLSNTKNCTLYIPLGLKLNYLDRGYIPEEFASILEFSAGQEPKEPLN